MSRVFFRRDESITAGLEDETLQFTKEFFDDDDLDIDLLDNRNIDEINSNDNVDGNRRVGNNHKDFSEVETDIEKLKRAWLNENYSPEILPYEPAFERLNSFVSEQVVIRKFDKLFLNGKTKLFHVKNYPTCALQYTTSQLSYSKLHRRPKPNL